MNSEVIGLERFGLTPAKLLRLGQAPVRVRVNLRSFDVTPRLTRLLPTERHAYLRVQATKWLGQLTERFPGARWKVESARRIPITLDGSVPAVAVAALSAHAGVRSVILLAVVHRRQRPTGVRLTSLQWYCLRARVAVQVEGQHRGLQTIEDRFVLVRAASEADATRRMRPRWRDYASPYLNSQGQLVRWQLEAITDVYEVVSENESSLDGAEVYSKLGARRLRPHLVWAGYRKGRRTTR